VVQLAWSNDPESHAGSSIATGRASHDRQVKVMTQTTWDTLVLQVSWGLGVRLTTPPYKKYVS